MKNLYLLAVILFCSNSAFAQWQQDVRLTNDPSVSQALTNRGVAATGDVVHVVWRDFREVHHSEIYYKRSTDGGVSWGADVRLTFKTQIIINDGIYQESFYPTVAVSGSVVHVVWHDERDGNYEIYYKRSVDGGTSWESDVRLSGDRASSDAASVSVAGSNVYVVWEDDREGNYEIYCKRSTNEGASWGPETRLTNDYAESESPCVSSSGSDVYVVWQDNRNEDYEIYSKHSADGGLSWGADTRLTNNPRDSYYPAVSISGSTVHVLWHDNREGNYAVYYKNSPDAGRTWGADTRLTNIGTSIDSFHASASISGEIIYVVWQDNRDNNYEIYYKRSTDGGSSWGADTRLTNNFGYSQYPSVALSGTAVHVIWQESRDGNDEIYYKRNPTGNPSGINDVPLTGIAFTVFPNPAGSEINVRSADNINELSITDIYGKQIFYSGALNATSELRIPTANFPAGIYFIQVKKGTSAGVQKLIKL